MKILYDQVSAKISQITTQKYSTSFSLGILCLDKSIRTPIYQIYGFVRIADEIVDSFHDYDKEMLLDEFERDTYLSIERKISTNPILNSFQEALHRYKIDIKLIKSFLHSMRMDLEAKSYDYSKYDEYIYGSAEAVGLMCLYVFVNGNQSEFNLLAPPARILGSAFQKINFLRDIQADATELGRVYFPNLDLKKFDDQMKISLLEEIDLEFDEALMGIKKLPKSSQFGVYVAYIYYRDLASKIKKTPANILLTKRIRISNWRKIWLLVHSYFLHRFVQ